MVAVLNSMFLAITKVRLYMISEITESCLPEEHPVQLNARTLQTVELLPNIFSYFLNWIKPMLRIIYNYQQLNKTSQITTVVIS